MLLFEDMDKNIQFYSLFRGIRKTFVSVRVRQVDILSEKYEAVSLYVLTDLEIRKREAYRKQTVTRVSFLLNKVSALKHDRFMQASLCTVCLLFANTLA